MNIQVTLSVVRKYIHHSLLFFPDSEEMEFAIKLVLFSLLPQYSRSAACGRILNCGADFFLFLAQSQLFNNQRKKKENTQQ
jgi:hypothetical protein